MFLNMTKKLVDGKLGHLGYCIDCQPIMAKGKDGNNFTQPGKEHEFSTALLSLDGNRSV